MTSKDIDREEGTTNGCDGWYPDITMNYDDDRTWWIQPEDNQSANDLFKKSFFCVDDTPYCPSADP